MTPKGQGERYRVAADCVQSHMQGEVEVGLVGGGRVGG